MHLCQIVLSKKMLFNKSWVFGNKKNWTLRPRAAVQQENIPTLHVNWEEETIQGITWEGVPTTQKVMT